jgi:hypothetical protein
VGSAPENAAARKSPDELVAASARALEGRDIVVRCVVRLGCLDEDTVVRLFRGELSGPELATVDHHIDGCAVCRVLLSSLAAKEVRGGPFSARDFASGADGALLRDAGEPPPPPSSSPLAPGAVLFDRFVVEELIGRGGMAKVFRGRDRETGGQVAIKVTQASSAEEVERSEREARLLLQLHHPSIVRHIADGRGADGTPYLVMEWLEGEDLAARLRRGPLDAVDTVVLGARVADALGAAHAVGIVHRDIKPSNIFLRDGLVDRATVLDFGVARPSWQEASSVATRTGVLLGTLGYMAPEQALGAKTADAGADVFSLGCVLFECLVGARLFGGSHAVEVLANLLTQPIRHPKDLVPGVPDGLDALVVRMLSRERAARPSDCTAIGRAFEGLATESAVTTWRGRVGVVAVAAAALLAVPLVLAVALHVRSPSPQSTMLPERAGTALASADPAPVALPPPSGVAAITSGGMPLGAAPGATASAEGPISPAVAGVTAPTATASVGPSAGASLRGTPPKRATAPASDPFGTFRN